MKKTKTQKGITLIALIITIIVLLILAIVAIQAVQKDGIIAHAKNARDQYEQKAAEENALLSNLTGYITGQIGGSAGGSSSITIAEAQEDAMLTKTTNSKTSDVYGNPITVPAGFKILVDSTTGYTADNINVTKGIVIQDGSGNEFVWIPVGNIKTSTNDTTGTNITLGRYSDFTADSNGNYTPAQPVTGDTTKSPTDEVEITSGSYKYTELQPTENGKGPNGNAIARNINNFYNSSIQNGGYYLGRYEAGDSSATSGARTGIKGTSTPGTLVCKANQEVYNWILQSDASAKSQAMYADGYSSGTFSSDLVNSYAWDTAIMFIQTFGTETDANSYASINKSTSFAKTGVNPDKYCNIYDLSGNAYEWTTETYSRADLPCTFRGGFYYTNNGIADNYTSFRYGIRTTHNYGDLGFRPLIYVALNA